MAAKPIILQLEPDYDFQILAITATVPDYLICIELDHQFDVQLVQQQPLKLIVNKQAVLFSWFALSCDVRESEICLLNNKTEGNYFLKEIKYADYFLRINGIWAFENKTNIADCLKKIEGVQAVNQLDVLSIKQKELLTFEMVHPDCIVRNEIEAERNAKIKTTMI
ncbi:MAG: hypothetical protein RIQ33_1816 [Bacteroidota bacterium]|jgi:hypothetical protein